jgi:hypothetical protein
MFGELANSPYLKMELFGLKHWQYISKDLPYSPDKIIERVWY